MEDLSLSYLLLLYTLFTKCNVFISSLPFRLPLVKGRTLRLGSSSLYSVF